MNNWCLPILGGAPWQWVGIVHSHQCWCWWWQAVSGDFPQLPALVLAAWGWGGVMSSEQGPPSDAAGHVSGRGGEGRWQASTTRRSQQQLWHWPNLESGGGYVPPHPIPCLPLLVAYASLLGIHSEFFLQNCQMRRHAFHSKYDKIWAYFNV